MKEKIFDPVIIGSKTCTRIVAAAEEIYNMLPLAARKTAAASTIRSAIKENDSALKIKRGMPKRCNREERIRRNLEHFGAGDNDKSRNKHIQVPQIH